MQLRNITQNAGRGFTLIELMIVVAVISILAAMAVPHLLESKMVANETTIAACLRTLHNAEELYSTRYGKYGDYFNLQDGAYHRYIDSALAKADPHHPQKCTKNGYWIDISVNGNNSDWCVIAYPATWGKTGERNFMIGRDGVIHYNLAENDHTNWTQVLGRN
jgi:prepilin-type N-terminal cleavage/methylation domain-containing protein